MDSGYRSGLEGTDPEKNFGLVVTTRREITFTEQLGFFNRGSQTAGKAPEQRFGRFVGRADRGVQICHMAGCLSPDYFKQHAGCQALATPGMGNAHLPDKNRVGFRGGMVGGYKT